MMCLAALTGTTRAEAQAGSDPGSVHVGAYLGVGGGGEYDFEASAAGVGLNGSSDAQASVAIGVFGEVALLKYLRVGGLFEARFGDDDSGLLESRWAKIMSFDLLLRGVYPFEVSRDLVVTPFVAVPVGFTVWVNGDSNVDQTYLGANWGLLFGSELVVNGNLAPFLALGMRWHRGNDSGGLLDQVTLTQFEFQVGFSFVFGG